LIWSSSLNGIIGYGEKFNENNLSLGNHIIRLNASDSSGVVAQDLINLEILEDIIGNAIEDVSEDKITICQKPNTHSEKMITIPIEALERHLNHEDYIGRCK